MQFQFHISLTHSKPMIWRRVMLSGQCTFQQLHIVIQVAMGWEDCHLYEFNIEENRIGQVFDDDFNDLQNVPRSLDAELCMLQDFVRQTNEAFYYLYDFGDGWQHQIVLEKIIEEDVSAIHPLCLDGAMNCPPENSGGIHWFYETLQILKNKKDPMYKEVAIPHMKRYNPEAFDVDKVNKVLKRFNY